jgi:hypothetical protein
VTPIPRDPLLGTRCRLVDVAQGRIAMGNGERVLNVGDGPNGPYWATSAWVIDDRGRVANQLPPAQELGSLAGQKLLTYGGGQLRVSDTFAGPTRVIRTLANACELKILPTRAGAFVAYRTATRDCDGSAGGPIELLKIDATGTRVELLRPTGTAPVAHLTSASMDNGRVVISVSPAQSDGPSARPRSITLDSEGAVLADSHDARFICPLVGCMSVDANGLGPVEFQAAERRLRWDVPSPSGLVEAVVVNGNRLLLALKRAQSEELNLLLVDTFRRRAESLFNEPNRTVMETWQERVTASTLRMRRTERGFAYIGVSITGELVARELDCSN